MYNTLLVIPARNFQWSGSMSGKARIKAIAIHIPVAAEESSVPPALTSV